MMIFKKNIFASKINWLAIAIFFVGLLGNQEFLQGVIEFASLFLSEGSAAWFAERLPMIAGTLLFIWRTWFTDSALAIDGPAVKKRMV